MGRRVLLTAWLLLWFAASVRGEEVQARRVLVIHSYGRDMSWTEDVHRGIQDFFAAQDPTLELRAEYLDTKHWTGSPYLDELGGLLRRKLRGVRLDGILLSDNNALDFFLRYLEPLFSQTPVVAVGINGPVNPRLPAHIRILPEATDLPKTLDLALRPIRRPNGSTTSTTAPNQGGSWRRRLAPSWRTSEAPGELPGSSVLSGRRNAFCGA